MARFKQSYARKGAKSSLASNTSSTLKTSLSIDGPPVKRVKREYSENPTEIIDIKHEKDLSNTLYDDIVFVKVGHLGARFGIHRGLLTKASTFFKELLATDQVSQGAAVIHEGDSTVILLEEDSPKMFARVNTWLYSGKLLAPGEVWTDISWDEIINVYVFSVEKGIAKLHNASIKATILKTSKGPFPSQHSINTLWELEVRATPLKRLLVKLFVTRCDLKKAIMSNQRYDQTFLNLLVIELYEMQESSGSSGKDNVWKTRQDYYVFGIDNPISID